MENFEQVLGRLMLVHAELKAIKPKTLSETRRKERSEQMTTLLGAIDKVVALRYDQLSASAQGNAVELDKATKKLIDSLSSMRTAVQTIQLISGGLRVVANTLGLVLRAA